MDESQRPSYEWLLEQVARLSAELVELKRENELLKEENRKLKERAETLERCSFRQAAPFRIPEIKRKQEPRKPGRKDGHIGLFRPKPEEVDETIVVPLQACPKCGSRVKKVKEVEQFIQEIPLVKPHVTRLVTYQGKCKRCGKVRSKHPKQVSLAQGAAATHLGARALGFATELNKRLGLTMRKTTEILQKGFGLKLSPGGLSQAIDRVGRRLKPLQRQLIQRIRAAPATYADETSWWVGGPGFWLWVFTTAKWTLYVVDKSRGSQVVERILGPKFSGTLISDCLATYDPIECRKHKCYAHHLKAIKQLMPDVAHDSLLPRIRLLLQTAIAWKDHKPNVSQRRYLEGCLNLETSMDEALASVDVVSEDQRIANRLLKRRPHLFTFLYYDEVEATNNRAERALRPAVIARKLSCGNKTLSGKTTWEILASLGATIQQQNRNFIDFIAKRMPLQARISF